MSTQLMAVNGQRTFGDDLGRARNELEEVATRLTQQIRTFTDKLDRLQENVDQKLDEVMTSFHRVIGNFSTSLSTRDVTEQRMSTSGQCKPRGNLG
jgi:uncharacterized protein YoxC